MKFFKRFAFAAFLSMSSFSLQASAQSTDMYTDAKNGFSIQKLSSWMFTSQVVAARVELKDGKVAHGHMMGLRVAFREVVNYKSRTLCSITEFGTASTDPMHALTKKMNYMNNDDKDYRTLQEAQAVTINSVPMAHAQFSYLDARGKETIREDYSVWFFMAGKQMFDFECVADDATFAQYTSDFEKMAQTIKVTQQ